MSLHDHNEARVADAIVSDLEAGRNVALVSDAGTPLVSDPGYRLVRAAHAAGVRVSPIPGASALTAALSVSGLPTDRFCFEGFPPARAKARREAFAKLAGEPRSIVFYESVHRIADFLDDAVQAFGASRPAFIGRELTKLHEQCRSATLGSLRGQLQSGAIAARGEFVIVVAGSGEARDSASIDADLLLGELSAILPARQAASLAARLTGERANTLYKRILALGDEAS